MFRPILATILIQSAIALPISAQTNNPSTLREVLDVVETSIRFEADYSYPLPETDPEVFARITYPSEVGALGAYVSPDPGDGARHPAIIWLTGGLSNTLNDMSEPGPESNDQTASAYRDAGIIMMMPTLRGGNENPGLIEGYAGEVDDILSAADYLASLSYVDPDRIYLGGHSTGGTLVFLVAEVDDRFAATFAFGPVLAGTMYGMIPANFEKLPEWEALIRCPACWMDDVNSPLFVIEGETGNAQDLREMSELTENPNIRFIEVPRAGHFDVLAPANRVIAEKILQDGPINISAAEIRAEYRH